MKDFNITFCSRAYEIVCGNDEFTISLDHFESSCSTMYVSISNKNDKDKSLSFRYSLLKSIDSDIISLALELYYKIY